MTITINGTDRTRLVKPDSLKQFKITNKITDQPDTCNFSIDKFGDRSFSPSVDDEVIVTKDGTKLFGGNILDINEKYNKLDLIEYEVKCVDYTRQLDRRMIVSTYEDTTVLAIIQDIKDNYLQNDITINNVDVSDPVDYIAFNYVYPSDALKQLADLTNSDWYIDYDKDIHFFKKKDIVAPFNLSDTNGNYIYESLIIRRDLSRLRNIIFVRGGEFLGDETTAVFVGDGTRRMFYLPYKMSNVALTVTGAEKSVGTDPIDLPDEYDALHNFQEKTILFRDDRKPNDGSEVRISGNPNLPVIVKMRDTDSIDTFTGSEFLVTDKSIKSKEGARQRALAELYAYRTTIAEGEFTTYTAGLRSGQKITIQSDLRGIDSEEYIINRVDTRIFSNQKGDATLIYDVRLMTTRTFDYINLLLSLINKDRKEIIVDENEIVDAVESIQEDINIGDTITVSVEHNPIEESLNISETVTAGIDTGTVFVLGPVSPGGDRKIFVLNQSPLA
jgi:hypothetical protein